MIHHTRYAYLALECPSLQGVVVKKSKSESPWNNTPKGHPKGKGRRKGGPLVWMSSVKLKEFQEKPNESKNFLKLGKEGITKKRKK